MITLSELRSTHRLAVVIPCLNEQDNVDRTVSAILELLESLAQAGAISPDSFVLVIDDGSTDGTWAAVERLHAKHAAVKGLKLSRNFGHQAALLAGLMDARPKCDAAISIDADLQQSPDAMIRFIEEWVGGADVVLGVRTDRASDSLMKRWSALSFYWFMNAMGVRTLRNHADYRLLSRRALDALALFPESNIFLRATCLELGFRVATVPFEVTERKYGATKYSFRRMLRLAIHGITSFSITPLRLVAVVGILLFLGTIVMGAYVAWRALVVGDTVPGWASTALPIYFIGGVQLLSLGIVGEYVGQIYATVKRRPRWICERRID